MSSRLCCQVWEALGNPVHNRSLLGLFLTPSCCPHSPWTLVNLLLTSAENDHNVLLLPKQNYFIRWELCVWTGPLLVWLYSFSLYEEWDMKFKEIALEEISNFYGSKIELISKSKTKLRTRTPLQKKHQTKPFLLVILFNLML